IRFRGVRLAGFALPFQIFDYLAVAVPNSYPKPDLLWDNVIAGPWGWPRSTVLTQVPARRSPMRRVGMHTECASRRFPSTNSLYRSGQFDLWGGSVGGKCERPAAGGWGGGWSRPPYLLTPPTSAHARPRP